MSLRARCNQKRTNCVRPKAVVAPSPIESPMAQSERKGSTGITRRAGRGPSRERAQLSSWPPSACPWSPSGRAAMSTLCYRDAAPIALAPACLSWNPPLEAIRTRGNIRSVSTTAHDLRQHQNASDAGQGDRDHLSGGKAINIAAPDCFAPHGSYSCGPVHSPKRTSLVHTTGRFVPILSPTHD